MLKMIIVNFKDDLDRSNTIKIVLLTNNLVKPKEMWMWENSKLRNFSLFESYSIPNGFIYGNISAIKSSATKRILRRKSTLL